MTLILSGTDGLSDVDGSAATPAIRGTDTNTGIFFPAADTIAFSEGGVESMRLDSSGNLGLGVTPSAWGSSFKAFELGSGSALCNPNSNGQTWLASNARYDTSWKYRNTAAATLYECDSAHKWYTAPSGTAGNAITFTQAMTLDSSGNLLVGTTSAGLGNNIGTTIESSGVNNARITVNHSNTGSSNDSNFMQFGYAGSLIGRIVQNTVSSVNYVTSSDYRLKENIAPMTGALAKVAALKPVTYKWKVDGSDGQGFIAHELQEVCPDAVSGEKDAVDEDGNIKPQGIDTSFLVATLTAAIQEQQAIIQSLTARIEALEGK